jgi:very-short-patch-repair endonuclease
VTLAEDQHGVLSAAQLQGTGLTRSAISRWSTAGRLRRLHRGVYALGHSALSIEGRLHAALLYAGPGAVLSHTTAAWLWQIIETAPGRIHVTVHSRRSSLLEVCLHQSIEPAPHRCRGFPVTPVARTLLEIASMLTPRQLRRALAEADYRGLLDPGDLRAVIGRGRSGSAALRSALRSHLPALAETRSVLEERFLELCEQAHLPQPEVNARIGRMTVDAVWHEAKVVAELDGGPAHAGPAAMKRDRQRDLALRALGYTVVRYTWEQITERPEQVIADLTALLATRPERTASTLSR